MRIYRLHAPRDLRLETEETPQCSEDGIVGETVLSLVSPGTERSAYEGAIPLRPLPSYPRLLGYCNLARVIESRCDIPVGDYVLTHAPHCSHFALPSNEVLYATKDYRPEIVAAYLYSLAFRALEGIESREVCIVGFGALGYAVGDLARRRAMTVYVRTRQSLLPAWAKPPAEVSDVVLTGNSWDEFFYSAGIATRSIALLGFPGRTEPTANPLAVLYPKGLTLRQIGEIPLERVRTIIRHIVGLLPVLDPSPLLAEKNWDQLESVYTSNREPLSYSTVLRW
jgi:hypothetical protein